METYDIVMLAVLLGAVLFGAWKGLAWQLASMASIFLSYMVAVQFRDVVTPMIKATPPWNVFFAMLILYVGASLVIWILFRFVRAFIDRVKLTEFDRQFGALFGFAKGVLLCVIITFFAVTLLDEPRKQSIINSYSGHTIARILDKAHGVMPKEIHDVLGPYIHRLDKELEPGAGGVIQRTATPVPTNPPTWSEGAEHPSPTPVQPTPAQPTPAQPTQTLPNGAADRYGIPPEDRRAQRSLNPQNPVPVNRGQYQTFR